MSTKTIKPRSITQDQADTIGSQLDTIRMLEKQLMEAQLARESAERRVKEQAAHIVVLQGDRDALTRTIEVLSRRLASPLADRDPVRAGWRAGMAAAADMTVSHGLAEKDRF